MAQCGGMSLPVRSETWEAMLQKRPSLLNQHSLAWGYLVTFASILTHFNWLLQVCPSDRSFSLHLFVTLSRFLPRLARQEAVDVSDQQLRAS